MLIAASLPGLAAAVDIQARAKLFGTAQALPSHDLQRRLDRTPAYDGSADFRLCATPPVRSRFWRTTPSP
ncbi:MAG: hypothetical protein OXG51_12495 [Gammaproteobacteria bacterium]|nr:hypothetical protein [Gammaproteobacteria bacterium]